MVGYNLNNKNITILIWNILTIRKQCFQDKQKQEQQLHVYVLFYDDGMNNEVYKTGHFV